MKKYVNFFKKHNVIATNQFGYQEGKSTVDAITQFTNNIFKAKAEKYKTMAIFLDLSKAFDCVNHSLLLSILWKYGVRGNSYNMLKSYLSTRKQCVKIKQADGRGNISIFISKLLEILYSVPQGSVLGPYLFIIYTNCIQELIRKLGADAVVYVDDTNIIIKAKTFRELQTKAVNILWELKNFFASLNLELNWSKTVYMLFDETKDDFQLSLDNIV